MKKVKVSRSERARDRVIAQLGRVPPAPAARSASQDFRALGEARSIFQDLEYPSGPRRKRHSANTGVGVGVIVTSPSVIVVGDNTPSGTTIATISVVGGSGAYTFTLVDPSGLFTIVGNQLQTTGLLAPGTYPITINGTNGLGDNPSLPTSVQVNHIPTIVATYPYYGF